MSQVASSSRAGAAVLALALAAGALGGCHRERDRARALALDWREGAVYHYTARVEASAGLSGGSPFDMAVTATLEVVPLHVSGARVELALALTNPVVTVGKDRTLAPTDPLPSALAAPYLLTLEGGRAVGQRFPPGLSPAAVGVWRTLGAALQLGDRPARAEQWTVREHDGTGPYEAEYRMGGEPGVVSKRKLRYENVLVAGNVDGATHARIVPTIVSSAGSLRVANGALASVELDDAVQSQVLMKSPLVGHTKVALALAHLDPPGAPAPDASLLLARTAPYPIDRPYGDGRTRARFERARLDGRSFEQLLTAVEARAKDDKAGDLWGAKNAAAVSNADRAQRESQLRARVGDFDALVALLHERPEAVGQAVAAVRGRSPAASTLLDGLASAGTDAAQAALSTLVADRALAPALRVEAAGSLIRVQAPSDRTVETLEALTSDPLLEDYGVFGLGTAARRLRDAGDDDRSRQIAQLLLSLLAAARTPADQIRCLRGISNSAYAGALEPVRALLAADDYRVRAAAVEAARLMTSPAVDGFLAAPLLKDPDARVRIAAVKVAARRPPSDTLVAALTEVALHDANAAARKDAVELLGRWLPDRRALRATLETVGSKDDRPEIRAAAETALKKA